ncbi:MAG: YdcF family protein [Bacteroidetes bacterium]|nr:YdcF family protein [Bacteroidota bacterium]
MLFVLSKIVGLFLKPLNLIVLTLLLAYLTKRPRLRRRALRVALALFLVFSNPWLISVLCGWWETGQKSPSSISEPYEAGIVLGGYMETRVAAPEGVPTFSRSGNRLSAALLLYQTGKVRHLLLSGGSGRLIGHESIEAHEARAYLLKLGVPDTAIWVEDRSRNTRENALYSKMIVDSLAPGARCLLISSAWHLRRADLCFQRAGLPCDLFGTDFFEEKSQGNPLRWLEPDWKALMKWECMMKEWVGSLVF